MKKMTTFLGGALIAAALLLSGCQNFLTANADAREKLQAEIKYAKAETVSFTIAPVSSEDGQVTSKATSAKIGFPVAIEFEVNQKVGSFVRWDVYSNYKGDGSDVALTDAVKFEREDARKTEMTIMSAVPNLRIIPRVSANPKVRLVTAKNELLQSMGSITPSGTQAWNPDNTHDISAEAENGYAIKGWKVYKKSGETDVPVASVKATDGDGNDLTRKYFGFDAPENPIVEFLSINVSETQKKSSATIKFNGSDIEGLYFEPVFAERPVITPLFELNNGSIITQDQVFEFEINRDITDAELSEAKSNGLIRVSEKTSSGTKLIGFSVSRVNRRFTIKFTDVITPKAVVDVVLASTFVDNKGITIGESRTYSYSMSEKADSRAPVLDGLNRLYYNEGNSRSASVWESSGDFNKNDSFKLADQKMMYFPNGSSYSQFMFQIKATDNNIVEKYEIIERVKYLPEDMVVPSLNAPNPDYQNDVSDYTVIQSGGVILFDENDNWTGLLSNESNFKKTLTGYFSDNTSTVEQNINYTTLIPIGGVHEFSIVVVDSSGNRSAVQKFYIKFKPSPLVLEKQDGRTMKLNFGWNSDSYQVNLDITSENESTNSSYYEILKQCARKSYYNLRESGYFILEKWNLTPRLMNVRDAVSLITYGNVAGGAWMSAYATLSLKGNNSIKGQNVTYSFAMVDKYGIPYDPVTSTSSIIPYAGYSKSNCNFYGVSIGDIVLYNPLTDYLYTMEVEDILRYDGNSKPLAAIISTKGGNIIGMGLEYADMLEKNLTWSSTSAYFYNKTFNYTGSEKEAWNYLVSQEKTAGRSSYSTPQTHYPAFNYCKTYGSEVLKFNSSSKRQNEKALASGWFLPEYKAEYISGLRNARFKQAFTLLNGQIPAPLTYTYNQGNTSQHWKLNSGVVDKGTRTDVAAFYDFTGMLDN